MTREKRDKSLNPSAIAAVLHDSSLQTCPEPARLLPAIPSTSFTCPLQAAYNTPERSPSVLELTKAGCFFLCIACLYQAAIHAFFVPGARWEERLLLAALRLAIAAYVCFMSALVFTLPVRSNPDRGKPLSATLPVRLFWWSSAGITGLFFLAWFLGDLVQQAAPFISNRSLQRF